VTYLETLEANIRQSVSAKLLFLKDSFQLDVFNSAVTAIVKCYLNNGRRRFCSRRTTFSY